MARKRLNCTLGLISLNHGNLIVIYHTLGKNCISRQVEILAELIV